MKKPQLDQTVKFMKFLHAFQLVERIMHVPNVERNENDAEHSYSLAMLAWYLIDSLDLKLDKQKVFEYCLTHDLVEIYAGDTYFLDEKAKETKAVREKEAQLQIEREFPEFVSLHPTITKYELQQDPESIFVHSLDKLAPVLTNFIMEGRTWKAVGVAFKDLLENKRNKIQEGSEVMDLFEQIIVIIEKDPLKYFPK
ncbi:MAG TPA: HD domain-containing protein [Candidatus Paceibacterota bacterium]|nr:HD domain-containing protein [Candidatus Paceibacterota bacterium]